MNKQQMLVHIKSPENDNMCGSLSSYWVSDHHRGVIEDFTSTYYSNTWEYGLCQECLDDPRTALLLLGSV
jgi:hypothetical protein